MAVEVGLRPVRADDCERLLDWRNRPAVARYMYTDRPILPEEHRVWFERMLTDQNSVYWVVELSGEPCGIVCVTDLDRSNRSPSWAFYIADETVRGGGIGLYLEFCILSYVFEACKFDSLQCEVLETNLSVQRLHESVGFEMSGRLKERAIKDGRPVDALCFIITKGGWLESRGRLEERLRSKGIEPIPLLAGTGCGSLGPHKHS